MSDTRDENVHTPPRDPNPEPRCPCVLLLDTSGSMEGGGVRELAAGLEACREELLKDPLTCLRAEIAVVTFGEEVAVAQGLVSPEEFRPPPLKAGGPTPMAAGVHRALDLIEERLRHFGRRDLDHYTPWVVMLTDGKATDPPEAVASAAERVRRGERDRRLAFFAVGVEGADMAALSRLAVRSPLKLRGLNFATQCFRWVSAGLSVVSHSRVGDRVGLPHPLGWAEV
jgi:uncharacterized protein YegL